MKKKRKKKKSARGSQGPVSRKVRDSEIQKVRKSEGKKVRKSERQEVRKSESQKFRKSENQKIRKSEIQKFRNSEIQKFRKAEGFKSYALRKNVLCYVCNSELLPKYFGFEVGSTSHFHTAKSGLVLDHQDYHEFCWLLV